MCFRIASDEVDEILNLSQMVNGIWYLVVIAEVSNHLVSRCRIRHYSTVNLHVSRVAANQQHHTSIASLAAKPTEELTFTKPLEHEYDKYKKCHHAAKNNLMMTVPRDKMPQKTKEHLGTEHHLEVSVHHFCENE